MSNFFLHANWEEQMKESAVVDGTSCCVILECLVTSIACITWLVSLLTKWPTTMSFRQRAVIEFLVKEEIPAAEIHQRLQCAYGSVCMGASGVGRWVKHFKDWKTSIQDVPSAAKVMGSLLGCRGVDFGRIHGTWANHHCCSLCPDTAQAPSCIAR